MQMATISRWTLAYFSGALVALVSALALMALGLGYPSEGLMEPRTLVVVHLITIGWLSLLMLGALMQFLPVLVGRELVWPKLPPVILALILSGLALLLCGFLALDGWHNAPVEFLTLGGLLLLAGFCVAAVMLFATLLSARSLPLPAGFVALGLLSLLVAATLGETLASVLAGLVGGNFSVALVMHGVGLHAAFGLGGWLTLAAMGVSYRLVSMFLVAPERKGVLTRMAFWSATIALGGLAGVLMILIATNASWSLGLALTGLAAALAIGAYLADIAGLYRTRRRARLELHMAGAVAGMAMLGLGAGLLAWALWTGSQPVLAAAIHVLALGWLGGLGLVMLYKIVAFLTWLECFAPHMGRMITPRVQDLVCERRAAPFFILYFAAELAGATAIVFGSDVVFRIATALQLLGVMMLIHQYVRARRLADLPEAWMDHPKPRLILPATRQRSVA
ncbi:hypothetical protein NIM87_13215 [Devosia sp. XJ19-1]|uniref:Uncharacterized protein n=1 Tax=Devosia ureilytica TaxID=2952754 RepID=A0A9Q4FS23_9HYPH|nr:hypothetical protein [Devosia ureilytica]MCP8884473.1 hypothetical protein [Devosia ureilytica]MCP8888081.1 hypothetical protein [Devosia ureilytica]